MGVLKNLKGKSFGQLTVDSRAKNRITKRGAVRVYWLCQCTCGKKFEVRSGSLTDSSRPVRSCGCAREDGRKKHPLYRRWCQMIARCENPKTIGFENYGGRGIKVCERWRKNFRLFLSDMGEFKKGMTIERIDTNKDYEPKNCIWADMKQQARNRRNTRMAFFRGKNRYHPDIAEMIGASQQRISKWALSGFNVEACAERYFAKRNILEKAK